MRGRQWKALAMATVAAVTLTACGGGDDAETGAEQEAPVAEPGQPSGMEQPQQQPVNLPEGVTMEQVNQGQQLFRGQGVCYSCHGPDATGTQLAPDLTDDEWINVSGPNMNEVVELIRTGVPQPIEHPGPMPPLGGANLTEEQVQALAAYVVSLGG